MESTIRFLIDHGYAVLFASVLAEQAGLPVSAVPILLAAGALAATGALSLPIAFGLSIAACVLPDLLWYWLGQRRGGSVLSLLCRLSLEPDSCVRQTEVVFGRHGSKALLYAKFVPGLSIAAPPLAGLFRMSVARFATFDSLGAAAWAGAFILPGYLFHRELEKAAQVALRLGGWLAFLVVGSITAYVGWRYVQRRRGRAALEVSRIAPDALHRKLTAAEAPFIVDLRHRIDVEANTAKIPGAVFIPVEEVDGRIDEIPVDREVILYCS